jgi:hypothetical protein
MRTMRMRNRERKTLLATLQEVRRTKERAEKEGGGEKHESGEPARGPKISEGHTGICGENRTV